MPSGERLQSAGKGMLLRSVPRKRANARDADGSEESPERLLLLPVTRDSDVIRRMKSLTNAGRTSGAGVVSGASLGRYRKMLQTLMSGSVA